MFRDKCRKLQRCMLGGSQQSWLVCRSLGVHCSKVRSLTLDSWEPELLKVRAEAATLTLTLAKPRRSHLSCVSAADVRARERRGQPHLRVLLPGPRPEEAAALQLTVNAALAPRAAAAAARALTRRFPPQAGEGGVDQSQVRGEEVPEEARLRPHARRRREEGGAAAEQQEVPEAQQHQQPSKDAAPVPTGGGKHLPRHAVCRY